MTPMAGGAGGYLLIHPILLNSLAVEPTNLEKSRAKLGQDHETLATAGVWSSASTISYEPQNCLPKNDTPQIKLPSSQFESPSL